MLCRKYCGWLSFIVEFLEILVSWFSTHHWYKMHHPKTILERSPACNQNDGIFNTTRHRNTMLCFRMTCTAFYLLGVHISFQVLSCIWFLGQVLIKMWRNERSKWRHRSHIGPFIYSVICFTLTHWHMLHLHTRNSFALRKAKASEDKSDKDRSMSTCLHHTCLIPNACC